CDAAAQRALCYRRHAAWCSRVLHVAEEPYRQSARGRASFAQRESAGDGLVRHDECAACEAGHRAARGNGHLQSAGGAMQEQDLRIGAKVVVSTTDGDMEDEVTRILVDADSAGIWVVETVRNG